jgi:hypothetical protein
MQLNPKLLKLIDDVWQDADDKDAALLYAAAVQLGLVTTLYKWGIFKEDADEHKYRILLCKADIDTDSLQRKFILPEPLFVNEVEEDVWDEFHKWLVKNPKLVHCKNKITTVTKEGKDAFKELQLIKDFDISRFKASVEQYYVTSGDYSKALPKFLVENARGEYEGFREVKSKLI